LSPGLSRNDGCLTTALGAAGAGGRWAVERYRGVILQLAPSWPLPCKGSNWSDDLRKWSTPVEYGRGFFVDPCLLFIALIDFITIREKVCRKGAAWKSVFKLRKPHLL